MELERLEIRIARSENLPVLPQAVSNVLRLADRPETSPRQIASCIERDPAITAKVLKAANSAYFGFTNVQSVSRAISCLGMNSIRSLVISVALQNMLGGRSASQSFNKLEYWQHSFASGVAGRVLASMRLPSKSDELFSAAMMHDIGIIAMERFMPFEFDDCVRQAQKLNVCFHDICRKQQGFDAAEVGALLADKWELPPMLKSAIKNLRRPEADGEWFETTCIVAMADCLANEAGFAAGLPTGDIVRPQAAVEYLNLPDQQFDVIKQVLVTEVERAHVELKTGRAA
ncbi:MAG: HDOD domain-containing protein [Fimbriimonadaceae bacterium]|nr:HDOD domain-containing protein [Fimbriimonadaceae bacterium]